MGSGTVWKTLGADEGARKALQSCVCVSVWMERLQGASLTLWSLPAPS